MPFPQCPENGHRPDTGLRATGVPPTKKPHRNDVKMDLCLIWVEGGVMKKGRRRILLAAFAVVCVGALGASI